MFSLWDKYSFMCSDSGHAITPWRSTSSSFRASPLNDGITKSPVISTTPALIFLYIDIQLHNFSVHCLLKYKCLTVGSYDPEMLLWPCTINMYLLYFLVLSGSCAYGDPVIRLWWSTPIVSLKPGIKRSAEALKWHLARLKQIHITLYGIDGWYLEKQLLRLFASEARGRNYSSTLHLASGVESLKSTGGGRRKKKCNSKPHILKKSWPSKNNDIVYIFARKQNLKWYVLREMLCTARVLRQTTRTTQILLCKHATWLLEPR